MGYAVELDFGGRTYRWENQDLSLTESFDFFNASPPLRSVSLALKLEDDVSALVAKGYRLDASQCRILDDSDTVQLTGLCQNPVWGYPEEPIRFTVREVPFDTGNIFPGPYDVQQVLIDERATAQARAQHIYQTITSGPSVRPTNYDVTVCVNKDLGNIPNVIIGHPGGYTDLAQGNTWPATPAIYIDETPGSEKLLLGCTKSSPPDGYVKVWGPPFGAGGPGAPMAGQSLQVMQEKDLSGRTITTLDLTASTVHDLGGTDSDWWISWIGTAPGPSNPENVSGLDGRGGELIKALIAQCFGLRVDHGRLSEVIPPLNAYRFDGYIDQQVNPWEYLQQQVLSLLPVSAVSGPEGLYLAPWFPDADPVDQFIENREASIDGPVKYERMKIINDLTFNFQYQADSQTFRQVVEVNGRNNAYAEYSQQVFGIRSKVLESAIVDDVATAQQMANWMVRAYAFPPRRLSLRVQSSRYSPRRVGDVVEVNLPSLSIDQRGIICEIERTGRPVMRIDVLLFDDILRGVA